MAEADLLETTVRTARRSLARPLRVPRAVGFVGISAALFAFFAAAGAPAPLLPLYERSWGFAPSMLTLAFGVYGLATIVALLVVGSLSDHVGRRPVLIGTMALELLAMVVFLLATSITWLIAGRVLQGLATGIASSTFAAAIVELAPERRKRLGAVMSSVATTAGLGIGALFSGLVAFAIPAAAARTVWIVLTVLMVAGTALALVTPETSARHPGALASLMPRLTVPERVRTLFAATSPSIAATFLVTAMFLGLTPTLLVTVFGVRTPLMGALLNFLVFTVATVTSLLTSAVRPHRLTASGDAGMVLGAVLLVVSIASGSLALVWAAALVGGAGAGAAFSGAMRGLLPEVEPHERARLLSALFTVAQLVFGGSAIAAGYVAAVTGMSTMAVGFDLVMGVVAMTGVVLGSAAHRRVTVAVGTA